MQISETVCSEKQKCKIKFIFNNLNTGCIVEPLTLTAEHKRPEWTAVQTGCMTLRFDQDGCQCEPLLSCLTSDWSLCHFYTKLNTSTYICK